MSWNLKRRSAVAGLAGAAALAVAALGAAPAAAVEGTGEATIKVVDAGKGRTLSGQGVQLVAGAGTGKAGGKLALPIAGVHPGDKNPSANSKAVLKFKRGKRVVSLSGISFNLGTGTLRGTLGGTKMGVFELGADANVNPTSGVLALDKGKLSLTASAAKALRERLGLARALRLGGVGTVWLDAKASPTNAVARPVTSGTVNWGVLASWRAYVLSEQGPGSIGSISAEAGATANGTMKDAGAFFGLPVSGGSYSKGLYGAADLLTLQTKGTIKFAKPGHCIIEVKFDGIELKLDGANSQLGLDAVYDIDTPAGMTCTPVPAVATNDVVFANLDLSGVAPSTSADGNTVTWNAIPAKLTAAGLASWGVGAPYAAGMTMDPVTITAGLG